MNYGFDPQPQKARMLNWRIRQFGKIIASGSGPESNALAEAKRYIDLHEFDDATTMTLQVQWNGQMRWRKMAT